MENSGSWYDKKIIRIVAIVGATIIIVLDIIFLIDILNNESQKVDTPNVPVGAHENTIHNKELFSALSFGDIMFDRGVRNIMERRNRDPFEFIKQDREILNTYGTIIANLEGPIIEIDRSQCQQKAYNFQFASTTPQLLKEVGIDMVSIANNHSFDCYEEGFQSTKYHLNKHSIDYIGDIPSEKSFLIKNIGTLNIAFVGIDETLHNIPQAEFYELIQRLNTTNDYVLVYIHWGTEYSEEATASQKQIAYNLIESGADAIFGSHPHVVEPVEIYNNKAIFYSLGNFIFDQDMPKTDEGIGVGLIIKEDEFVYTIHPYKMKIFAPYFLKDLEQTQYCNNFLDKIANRNGCSFKLRIKSF